MTKENWCRVFQVGDKQVLFTNLFDAENDKNCITISHFHEEMGAYIEMKFGFDGAAEADACFETKATQETAVAVLANGLKGFSGASDGK